MNEKIFIRWSLCLQALGPIFFWFLKLFQETIQFSLVGGNTATDPSNIHLLVTQNKHLKNGLAEEELTVVAINLTKTVI